MNKVPQYFKYRPINKFTIESIVTGLLYFPSRKDLNDPFDCQINPKLALDAAIALSDGEERKTLLSAMRDQQTLDILEKAIDASGIFSLSLDSLQTLMWAHYADQHKGICISYQFPEEFLTGQDLIGASEVSYKKHILDDVLKLVNVYNVDTHMQFAMNFVKLLLTTKYYPWKYEKEVRIISREFGHIPITGTFIRQICFGLRTPPEDEMLIKKLSRSYCPDVKFSRIVRGEHDFGIETEEIGS